MALLSLTDVSLTFQRGRRHAVRVLAGVSLNVHAGEVVSVLAQRAQGKTSLLRVAAGLQRPNVGWVRVAGRDVWGLSTAGRARLLGSEIGWVGHAAPDLDVPVRTSVALPLLGTCGKREAYARASAALERVGVLDCAEQFWGSLADWERALVALAHGIAREPCLLLVDDLTLSLDLGEVDDATRLLDELARERDLGVLMCVSDANATRWSQRTVTLAGGELLAPARPGPVPAPAAPPANVIDFPSQSARRASS
ncbi:MAG TPA: ABC transporter ATP-binding protein [Solirubrobacteraceae bacterium]|jgi:predicted ABC-type transport system involved in lysophospholipase L1 biosynthesis ATPase subunit